MQGVEIHKPELTHVVDKGTAAPLFCAGVTAFHAIENCELQTGQWVVCIGAGGLGHLGIQYAKSVMPLFK